MGTSFDQLFNYFLFLIAGPLILLKSLIFDAGNFVVFDVLNLGPYLPITL